MDINQIIEQECEEKYPIDFNGKAYMITLAQYERKAYKAGRLKSIERIKALEEILRECDEIESVNCACPTCGQRVNIHIEPNSDKNPDECDATEVK